MAEAIRYGVIGTGMMGCEHIRNLARIEDAAVVAIADPVASSRELAVQALGDDGDARSYDDARALLEDPAVDAVVIATPNHTHRRILDLVFQTDKHVLVEKPLCATLEDCRAVVEHAERHAGVVWVGLEYRYMPPVARFLREIAAGAVGQTRMLAIREHRHPFLPKVGSWNRFNRNTGGTLVEKCCHFFDLMNLVFDAAPVRVYASGGQDVNHLEERYGGERPDVLDNAFVIVDYAGGGRACLDLCMFAESNPHEQELVATGDRGRLECSVGESRVRLGTRRYKESTLVEVPPDPRVRYAGFHHGASYLEHLDFLEAIRSGGGAAVAVGDGLLSVALGVAAHLSIDEGRPVELAELGLPAGAAAGAQRALRVTPRARPR